MTRVVEDFEIVVLFNESIYVLLKKKIIIQLMFDVIFIEFSFRLILHQIILKNYMNLF